MMDPVEVIVEKECYAKEGVHKGMQGWICLDDNTPRPKNVPPARFLNGLSSP